jgi:uncharacterized membrane protein
MLHASFSARRNSAFILSVAFLRRVLCAAHTREDSMAMQRAQRSRGSGRNERWSGDGFVGTNLDEGQAAVGLGWFSLALGLALIAAPGEVARVIGVPDSRTTRGVLGFVGAREIAAGVITLAEPRPTIGMWSRVAGDLMDMALLTGVAVSGRAKPSRLALAFSAVAGIVALDALCAERLSTRATPHTRMRARGDRGVHILKVVTVDRPAAELYHYWRNVENLPHIMTYLESVEAMDDHRSHWRAKGPLGSRVEWDAEITEDIPDERIAWQSPAGATIRHSGSVSFEPAPGDRGTVVRVELHYLPPAGALGAAVAKLFGRAPEQEIQEDLRHFKQLMETGEVLLSDATAKGWGAAQPQARSDH